MKIHSFEFFSENMCVHFISLVSSQATLFSRPEKVSSKQMKINGSAYLYHTYMYHTYMYLAFNAGNMFIHMYAYGAFVD
jgi:hypothetical protein